MNRRTRLEQRMSDAVRNLAVGEVVSYADVAARAGRPGASRAAGRLLAKSDSSLPWWRVVYSDGRLPQHNPELHQQRLEQEGVVLKNGRVVSAPLGRFET
ncbi:MAG: MGMT family protein [Planctomycetota bacterium]